jgi:hypothetical protein
MRHRLLKARRSGVGSVFTRMFVSPSDPHSPSSTRLSFLPLDGTDPLLGGHRLVLGALDGRAGGCP